jgi:hypothetical protein
MKPFEMLCVRFAKNAAGTWAINALQGLKIGPKDGTRPNFYEVDDEMVVIQPNSFGPTSYFLAQSIVPIVAQVRGENTLRCLGTGFFISCSGLLITAAHVVSDPIEREYGRVKELPDQTYRGEDLTLGVMIQLNPLVHGKAFAFRPIEWASFLASPTEQPFPTAKMDLRLSSDTAICKVAPLAEGIPYQPLTIVQSGLVGSGMDVGRTATAVGYGSMQDVELEQESGARISGDFHFNLHVSTGSILERFPDNAKSREVRTPGACFSAELELPGGMSGSPIFDHEGIYVHGVVSSGLIVESGIARHGYGSMLAHSMHVPIRTMDGKTLSQLHGELTHGFSKLSGPGI